MCLLIAQVLMLIGGLYALIAGKIKLTRTISLQGWRARAAGLLLMAPLPLGLLTGFIIGLLVSADALPQSTLNYVAFLDIFCVVGGLALAVVFALFVRERQVPSP
jgi:hypothetical protein